MRVAILDDYFDTLRTLDCFARLAGHDVTVWTDHAQEATAGQGAELELGFLAQDVYLVLGGTGTLDVSVNGHHTQTLDVAGVPRLYTLYQAQAGSAASGKLVLHASPGVEAYDFTFG